MKFKNRFAKIRRRFYYYGALAFAKSVSLIPYKLSVGFLSLFFGKVAYYCSYSAAKIAVKNLQKTFPNKSKKEIVKIAKTVFVNQARNFFELANFPRINLGFLQSISSVENKNLIEIALQKGKGLLFVSAHTGNWEITAAAVAALGLPVNVVAKKIYIDGLNDMLVKYRESKNVKVILKDAKDTGRKLLRALKNGEIIAMLIDQDTEVSGVFVDFFGQKAWTPSGLAVLALKTGAEVLVGVDQRIGRYNHKTIIYGPVKIETTGNVEIDVVTLTQKATSILEEHIRICPEQWVWFHKRWKTQSITRKLKDVSINSSSVVK
ncbi:MAG: lysophospholipid acyltransferase family protein [Elusimicrobiota bacterium]|nr:lysophospholipid acyltransferase family protein [Elusimicrobiota bacterium]